MMFLHLVSFITSCSRRGAASWHADKRGLTALHWAAALGFSRIGENSPEIVAKLLT